MLRMYLVPILRRDYCGSPSMKRLNAFDFRVGLQVTQVNADDDRRGANDQKQRDRFLDREPCEKHRHHTLKINKVAGENDAEFVPAADPYRHRYGVAEHAEICGAGE